MPDTRTVKKILNWKPLTKKSHGIPKYRWEDNIKQDFRICKSVHLHTFKRINTKQMQQLITGLLLVVYMQLNMFRPSSRPSSGATITAVAASGLP